MTTGVKLPIFTFTYIIVLLDEEQIQRRIHSVVKERRGSSEEANQPIRTYYNQ